MRSKERDIQIHGREQGTILLLTLLFALMVGFVAANAVSTALMQSKDSQYSFHRTDSLALAEGATESAQKRMLIQVANFRPPTLEGVVDIGSGSYPYFIEAVGPFVEYRGFCLTGNTSGTKLGSLIIFSGTNSSTRSAIKKRSGWPTP